MEMFDYQFRSFYICNQKYIELKMKWKDQLTVSVPI